MAKLNFERLNHLSDQRFSRFSSRIINTVEVRQGKLMTELQLVEALTKFCRRSFAVSMRINTQRNSPPARGMSRLNIERCKH